MGAEKVGLNYVKSDLIKRDNAISFIRFVSMIMIVLCHFLQYFNLELAWCVYGKLEIQ